MAVLDEPKGWVALIVGLLVTAIGGIPLASSLNLLPFSLPGFIANLIPAIAIWLIPAIALLLFIDSAVWEEDFSRMISVLVALVFLVLGIIEILHKFSIISFGIPFLTDTVYYIIFLLEGIFLILAAFWME